MALATLKSTRPRKLRPRCTMCSPSRTGGPRPAAVQYLNEHCCYECAWRLRDRYEQERRRYVRRTANRALERLAGICDEASNTFDIRVNAARVAMERLEALVEAEYVDDALRAELRRAERWAREAWFRVIDSRGAKYSTSDLVKKAVG